MKKDYLQVLETMESMLKDTIGSVDLGCVGGFSCHRCKFIFLDHESFYSKENKCRVCSNKYIQVDLHELFD